MQNQIFQKQRGAALIVSLIMLLLITLLAISSMNTTVLEEKMAGNYKDRNMAFQAAEAGLRAAETYLRTTPLTALPAFDGTTAGLYKPTSAGQPRWNLVNWNAPEEVVTYAGELRNISSAPKYIIEELEPVTENNGSAAGGEILNIKYYRITSRGVGGTDSAIVMLQNTFKTY